MMLYFSVLGAHHWIDARRERIANDRNGYRVVASEHNWKIQKCVQPKEPKVTTIHRSNKWPHHRRRRIKMSSRSRTMAMLMLTKLAAAKLRRVMWRNQPLHTSTTTTINQSTPMLALHWAFCYQLSWLPVLLCGCSMHIVIHTRKAVSF